MTRTAIFFIAAVAWLTLLLAWAAGVRPGDPWSPARQMTLSGAELMPISGEVEVVDGGVRIGSIGPLDQGLQSWRVDPPLPAAELPILHFEVSGLPRTLELALIYRRSATAEDVDSLTLPRAHSRGGTVNLEAVPGWRGDLVELGFSEYPVPSLVPPETPFTPFVIHALHLESRSVRGQLLALLTQWRDWTPWSLRSVHINAPVATGNARAEPNLLLPVAALGIFLLWLLLQRRRGVLPAAVILVALAWLLVDAGWIGQLRANHALSQQIFGDAAWNERSMLVADRPLLERAVRMRAVLAQQPEATRVLYWVASGQEMDRERLGYFLRPANVAPLDPRLDPRDVPDGTLLLIDNDADAWTWAPADNLLSRGQQRFHGDLLWHQGHMLLLSVRAEAGS